MSKPTPREVVKRKQWTDKQMRAVKAAGDHGVPLSSLKERISGQVQPGEKPGPRPYMCNSYNSNWSNSIAIPFVVIIDFLFGVPI